MTDNQAGSLPKSIPDCDLNPNRPPGETDTPSSGDLALPIIDDTLHARFAYWRSRIFVVTWLAYAGLYLTRKSFAVAKILVGPGTAIGLTKDQMGLIDTAYSCAYALGQILFGVCGDRFGPRRVVLAGLLCSVVVAVGMGMSTTALMFGGFFFLQGLCQATGWAPLSKNMSHFFSRRERGSVMGMWCTNYAAGGWLATILASWCGAAFGWRAVFWIPAAVLLGIALLFWLFQRDRPEDVGLPSIDSFHGEEPEPQKEAADPPSLTAAPPGALAIVWEVLNNPMVALLCFTYFLLKPARYLLLFWGPAYVHESLGSGVAASGFIASAFELGGPLGALLAGFLSDKVCGSRRVPVSVVSLLVLAVLLYCLDDIPATAFSYAVALFFIGVFLYAADSLLSGTSAVDFGTKDRAATASGLINGSGSLGQILGPAIPLFVPKSWGWHEIFMLLSLFVLAAAVLILPKWNAVPRD